MRKIADFSLRPLSFGNFLLQVLVGRNQIRGSLCDAPLEILVHLAQGFVGLVRCFLRSLPSDLTVYACQCDHEIHRLGDVVVGSGRERLRDVSAFGPTCHHDDRERNGRVLLPYSSKDFKTIDIRHHDV